MVAAVLPQAVSDHRRIQQRLILQTISLVRGEWLRMGSDLDSSWANIGRRVTLLTASAQLGSARNGMEYVSTALESQGTPVAAEARIQPRGLAGLASDGRSLETLLYSAVIHARTAKVDSLPERLRVGGLWLDKIVQTQVADAGRDASKVAITVRPRVRWVRIVSAPCCQRCAATVGEERTFSHEFKRHPGCDCTMLPQTVANPDAAWNKVDPSQVTDLTAKQRAALDKGADFHATVNDYQRKRGDYSGFLPPTRVDKVIDRAGQRDKAMDALRALGIVA